MQHDKTKTVTARVTNAQKAAVRRLARQRKTTVSRLVKTLVVREIEGATDANST